MDKLVNDVWIGQSGVDELTTGGCDGELSTKLLMKGECLIMGKYCFVVVLEVMKVYCCLYGCLSRLIVICELIGDI